MSISISDARPMRGTRTDDAMSRAIDSTADARDRFVIVEGARGAGKTHALAGIAAAARADGHGVVQLRSSDGDPVISASSVGPWVALFQDRTRNSAGSGAQRARGRRFVLVDDFHTLVEGARTPLHSALSDLVEATETVCVVAVDDRRLVPGWEAVHAVPLSPLDRDAAEDLLRSAHPDLPPVRAALLLRLAAGNPLLLTTIGRAWSADPVESRSAFPASYPPLGPASRQAAWIVGALDPAARESALLGAIASVEFDDDHASWGPEAPGTDAPLGGTAASAPTSSLRDPVVRAHLLSTASPDELRRLRTLVAASAGAPERLRVLAAASASRNDDVLVPRLVALVDEALRLHRPQDATAALQEAARLSTSGPVRDGLRARAASIAAFTGDFASVDDEAARVTTRGGRPHPAVTASVEFARAVRAGEIRDGRRAVTAALTASTRTGDDDLLFATLHVLCFLRGDGSWWDEALALGAGRDIDPVLRVVEDCLVDRPAAERPSLYRDASTSAADGEPWKAVVLHVAWSLLDATDPRREAVDAILSRFGDHGLPGYFRACRTVVVTYQAGRLELAQAMVERVRAAASTWHAETFIALADATAALISSVQGEPGRATEKADSATRWALHHGAPLVARAADQARSALDVAMGRFEEAYARSATRPPTVGRRIEHTYGPVELLDAVESAVRLRMGDHGRALVRAAERALHEGRSPRQAMIVTASRAVLDDGGDARVLFEAALALVDDDEAPYETARVRLAYGEWLRRNTHSLEARTQFRAAASTFESLGAGLWTARAQSELRVAGGSGTGPVAVVAVELSEQERRVASLAAAGLTNKQIANRLFLSPRTVSGHLYRLFPKLGVTTRAGLRDALLSLEASHADLAR